MKVYSDNDLNIVKGIHVKKDVLRNTNEVSMRYIIMFIYSFFRMKDQVQVQDYFWEYNDFFNDTLTLSDGQIHEQICDKQFRSCLKEGRSQPLLWACFGGLLNRKWKEVLGSEVANSSQGDLNNLASEFKL